MSDTPKSAGGGDSLPEDIAAGAGLPRVDESARTLHARPDRTKREAAAAVEMAKARSESLYEDAGDAVAHVRDTVEETADTAARGATRRGEQLRARAAGAADVARERVGEAFDSVRERAADAYDDAQAWAADRYDAQRRRAAALAERGYGHLRDGRSATEDFVSNNPLLVGVVGLAAGLLLGALLPRTRREAEAIGPYADELRDQGLRYAREMTHRGRAFVETALDPENLDAAVRRAEGAGDHEGQAGKQGYEGSERTAHRL